jgi:hypothetical protein
LTLTNRLRLAALARAERGGRVVGPYVIHDDGVIDLRALEDRARTTRSSEPASLKDIAGRYSDDAGDITHLYVADPIKTRKLFRRGKDTSVIDVSFVAPDVLLPGQARAIKAGSKTPLALPNPAAHTDPVADPVDDEVIVNEDELVADLTEAWSEPLPEKQPSVIDLREDQGPTPHQTSIMDFNQSNPFSEAPERDIGSGIEFGHHGSVPPTVPPPQTVPRPTLFGNKSQSATVQTACPMCGGVATRDFANRFLEIDFYSCGDCFHMWHLTADDTTG